MTVAAEVETSIKMCGSRKSSSPPQGGLLEIPQGRDLSKGNILKQSMKQNWNLQRTEV